MGLANPTYVRLPHPRSSRFQSFHAFYPFYLVRSFRRSIRRARRRRRRRPRLAAHPLTARFRRHAKPSAAPAPPLPCSRRAQGEHANRTCRRLHVVGTSGVVALAAAALVTRQPAYLLALPLVGYGFAWAGHFFFEHNRPATFKYPGWSLRGDLQLWCAGCGRGLGCARVLGAGECRRHCLLRHCLRVRPMGRCAPLLLPAGGRRCLGSAPSDSSGRSSLPPLDLPAVREPWLRRLALPRLQRFF